MDINTEDLNEQFVGKYFIDKYSLDSEDIYDVTHIFRVDRANIDYLSCTKISICYCEKKKTGEKTVIVAEIRKVDIDSKIDENLEPVNSLISMKKTTKSVWEKVANELVNVVVENSGIKDEHRIS